MKEDINGNANRISRLTKIVGNIESESDFRIDGFLEGNIITKGRLVIGKEGEIKGNIECDVADISGKTVGNIIATSQLSLRSESSVEGEVTVGKLLVEQGAVFNAMCKMNKNIESKNK